ncbi:MAG TPA: tol-pal system-associated acyl-CoA thioesterase [Oxalicibacterium sp.]|nr:tol-pal system-associated acyl-CoA thioesterase [Oxalicibacterium sp.]
MSTQSATPAFTWTVRVYYEDTDAGGVVFYANYLKFFERARTEWLRSAGISQQTMTQEHGVMFVVKSTAVDYHAPARLDNELMLTVSVEKMGRASVQFIQQAWRSGEDRERQELLATGHIKIGCVDTQHFRPSQIPQHVLQQINAMET